VDPVRVQILEIFPKRSFTPEHQRNILEHDCIMVLLRNVLVALRQELHPQLDEMFELLGQQVDHVGREEVLEFLFVCVSRLSLLVFNLSSLSALTQLTMKIVGAHNRPFEGTMLAILYLYQPVAAELHFPQLEPSEKPTHKG